MKLEKYGDIFFPEEKKFRSWIVTGPPGSGKSHLMQSIGGWPDEICIDVTQKRWWAVEPLTHRPREIHFALPFKGVELSRSVYDETWKGLAKFPEVAVDRIRMPKEKKFLLSPDWRARFVFDFILPPPEWIFERRRRRLLSSDASLVDMGLTPEWVKWQVHTYWAVARCFHLSGFQVLIRPFNTARPFTFPVLNQIGENITSPSTSNVGLSTNWSNNTNVHRWINDAAPLGMDILRIQEHPLLTTSQA